MSKSTVDFGSLVGEVAAARSGKKGLGAAVDDLQPQAQFFVDAGEKLGAVLCRTASLRCNQSGAKNAALAHFVATDAQRVQSAQNSRLGEPAGL